MNKIIKTLLNVDNIFGILYIYNTGYVHVYTQHRCIVLLLLFFVSKSVIVCIFYKFKHFTLKPLLNPVLRDTRLSYKLILGILLSSKFHIYSRIVHVFKQISLFADSK